MTSPPESSRHASVTALAGPGAVLVLAAPDVAAVDATTVAGGCGDLLRLPVRVGPAPVLLGLAVLLTDGLGDTGAFDAGALDPESAAVGLAIAPLLDGPAGVRIDDVAGAPARPPLSGWALAVWGFAWHPAAIAVAVNAAPIAASTRVKRTGRA
ncbi:MAG: hypothetical protein ACR2F6_04110 [Mycobacteriales bacterium]